MTTREFVKIIAESNSNYPLKTFSVPNKVYTCVNPYSYHIVRKNSKVYQGMDGLFVDGMTMCWWIRLLWNKKITRLSFDMAGMAKDLFEALNQEENQKTIYFIGAKQEEINGSISQIQKTYPNIPIKGYRNGYFNSQSERNEAIQKIIKLNPDYTIIGMGSPMQEQFALDLKNQGYAGIAFTCGGFLHQSRDKMNYYPDWVNRYNLRAFYRLAHEKGLTKRLWDVLIGFPCQFTLDSIFNKTFALEQI